MVTSFEMLHDCSADKALAKADHIRHKAAAVVTNDLDHLLERRLLEIRERFVNLVVPHQLAFIFRFESVAHERVKRLHVNVVRPNQMHGPRLLHLAHQRFVEILCFGP